jgi:hypothetical protein
VPDLWYPKAVRLQQADNGEFTGGPRKGVLHSTEAGFGKGWASFKPGTHSHFEVIAQVASRTVLVRQFYPLDQPSRALVDGPQAVRTNRDGAIQVELGFQAAHAADVPAWFWTGTAELLRWIEDNAGVNPEHWANFEPYPKSFGASNGVRFSVKQWDAFDGWCGHQHVPDGNVHGDPGLVPVNLLRRPSQPAGRPPVLRRGTRAHGWVMVLQKRLNDRGAHLEVNGKFDAATRARVRRFKVRHGLPPTTTVGSRAWHKLGVK